MVNYGGRLIWTLITVRLFSATQIIHAKKKLHAI